MFGDACKADVIGNFSFDRRGHLVKALVALHFAQPGHLDRAGVGDARKVVAHQIDDHGVFGPLLGIA